MNNRGFLSVSLLSLSLIFNIHAADIPNMGNYVVQIIQAASFCTALLFKGPIDYKPVGFDTSTGKAVYGMPKSAPFVINTSEQTKTHASTGDTSSSHETSPDNKDEAPHVYGFAPSEKEIARREQQKKSEAQQKRTADYWDKKAQRKKEYIEKQKAEKQEKLAQQVTTLGASAQVLITQTTPATESNEPMVKAKEDKPQSFRRNDGADSKKDMRDNEPPHETGKELNFNDKPNQGIGAHSWRQDIGHYGQKTVENMKDVQNAVTKGTFRGVKNGKFQYDWTCPETGKQVWVETIDNTVQNCGFNAPGEHWVLGKEGFLVHPKAAESISTGLLKGVTVVGTGSVAFSSEYLAQTQEDAQKNAKRAAIENRFNDIIDPYGSFSIKTAKPEAPTVESTAKTERAARAAAEDPFGYGNFTNNTAGNLVKSDSDGRIDYKNVTNGLVRNIEPKTNDVKKIMDDVVRKSIKTDKESIKKAMHSKPKYAVKFSESHKKSYSDSMKSRLKTRLTNSKKD